MFQELLSVLMEREDLVVDNTKSDFFTKRTNDHIQLVKSAASKIVEAFPELKELLTQVKDHDSSKFEDPEKDPYIELTWKKKIENEGGEYEVDSEMTDQIYQATLHHTLTNSHHPECHLEGGDKSGEVIDASQMPEVDIAEMVADWQAMAEELGTNTAREWYNDVENERWTFSEEQKDLIDKLLKVFE